ncbi:DUF4232 domain-containing protein [Streptomyces sp. NPDC050263]|uniref:DUF4232 domain-containing protein n=1 Tax=Streptomyces sp. NPDC050263 TaxID=3155037 RepID=UPI00341E3F03
MRINRLAVVLAASAVLAVALTSCGREEGDGDGDARSAATGSSDATVTPTAPSASASATATASPTRTGSGSAKAVDCTPGSLEFAVKKVSRPLNHVLITATNTGAQACRVHSYPALRLSEDSQSVTDRVEESQPQSVVTLDRGATAYAGLTTASADGNSQTKVTTSTIGLYLFGPDEEPSDSGAELPVPGGSLYVEEDNARVTYWQDDANAALAW